MHFRMASLERECQDLVQNVVNQGNYASFDLVLGGLLAKHGASDLRSLGVASLPTLDILWAIQHRIGIFADTYSVNQSIISFIDFEIDLMCLLRSFCIPKVASASSDPNELDIDDDGDDDNDNDNDGGATEIGANDSSKFASYGVGPLLRHPAVSRLFSTFQQTSSVVEDSFSSGTRGAWISTATALKYLLQYHHGPTLKSVNDHHKDQGRHSVEGFREFLALALGTQVDCFNFASVGLVIMGDFAQEEVLLRHVGQRRRERYVEACRNYFNGGADERAGQKKRQRKRPHDQVSDSLSSLSGKGVTDPQDIQDANESIEQHQVREQEQYARESDGERERRIADACFPPVCGLNIRLGVVPMLTPTPTQTQEGSEMSTHVDVQQVPHVCLPWKVNLDTRDKRAVGRWGEALVYNLLLQESRDASIEWMNEHNESLAPYDIVIRRRRRGQTLGTSDVTFVEVKTTSAADKRCFPMSIEEWRFATDEPRPDFHIYRVYGAGGDMPRVEIIKDLNESIANRKVELQLSI